MTGPAPLEEAPGPGCERVADGLLVEPVSAVTSLAFVVAAVVLLRRGAPRTYAALVAAVGIGSAVDHGPDPAWSDLVHDLPLVAVLALLASDAAYALRHRSPGASALPRTLPPAWTWLAPTAALVPLLVGTPRLGDAAQGLLAAVAIALVLLRARRRPALRRPVVAALVLLAVGGAVGTLSRAGGPLCDPDSLWQGHGLWHLLAAAALVVLGPVVGDRSAPAPTTTSVGGRAG